VARSPARAPSGPVAGVAAESGGESPDPGQAAPASWVRRRPNPEAPERERRRDRRREGWETPNRVGAAGSRARTRGARRQARAPRQEEGRRRRQRHRRVGGRKREWGAAASGPWPHRQGTGTPAAQGRRREEKRLADTMF
jgi:hypothetical protein